MGHDQAYLAVPTAIVTLRASASRSLLHDADRVNQ
jgi:hypothetical protein